MPDKETTMIVPKDKVFLLTHINGRLLKEPRSYKGGDEIKLSDFKNDDFLENQTWEDLWT